MRKTDHMNAFPTFHQSAQTFWKGGDSFMNQLQSGIRKARASSLHILFKELKHVRLDRRRHDASPIPVLQGFKISEQVKPMEDGGEGLRIDLGNGVEPQAFEGIAAGGTIPSCGSTSRVAPAQ